MVQTMLRFASLAVLSLTILGCGGEKPPVLKVCATGNVGFFHLKNGQPSGVEYDILNSFAESQSIGIEVSWDDPVQVLEKVVAEQCEIGAGIFTPTPARKESLDFSVSYFPVKVLVLTKADTAVQTVEDLAGKRIAVINGSSQPAIAETIPGVEPVLVSSIEETAEAVMNGTADVTILDSILAPSLLKAYPDLQPMFFLPQRGDIAFALQKEWPLRSALNAHIEQLRQGDEFDQILLLHFDPEMVELLIPPSPSQESETDE